MPTPQNVLGFIFEITILAAMITISYILKPKLTATIGLLAITILFVAAATRLQHGLATKIRECIPMDGLGGVKTEKPFISYAAIRDLNNTLNSNKQHHTDEANI